ncbi:MULTISPECIES: hypothetical protein [Acinetobacter]|uniref:Uncharacterized protein n=1 Tax=Acinetobacter indicus TaxID=756892 RepID=A0A6C0Y946_9GAMM|nr:MULTISPECIES: hypothetical protein [Acinetobacter]QIC72115.1 hypothetical protein FSC09_17300 [Acinetobacter indicus]QKQ71483.1 hypothetical protein E5Y90_14725 [Acinetobacter sp. 10FS3-1]
MTTHEEKIRLDMINFARNSCTVTTNSLLSTVNLQCNVDSEVSHLLQDHEADEFIRKVDAIYNEGGLFYEQAEYLVAHEYLDLLQP